MSFSNTSIPKAAFSDTDLALTKARTNLLLNHPFFGSMALRLRLRKDQNCKDLWTNGKELGYNPAWVSVTPLPALEAALAHEMLHIALGHHVRRKNRDLERWNTACDYAVNILLQEAGFTLPQSFPVDESFAEKTADAIFELLPALQEQTPHGGAKRARQSKESTMPASSLGQDLGGASANTKSTIVPKNASNESGHSAKKQTKPETFFFLGEIRDHPLLSDTEETDENSQKKAEQEARIDLILAMQRAFHEGDMPGSLQRLMKARITPHMDWRELLLRFLEVRVENDSTWTHPNKRYCHLGLYLPSRSEPTLPPLYLAVDSSGSVDNELLSQFCTELSSILETYTTTLTVLTHDSRIQEIQHYERRDLPLHILPKGGGGTDFRPVCEWIEQEGIHPVCLLWFTDLECSRFPDPPDYPVLWICPKGSQRPPFGDVLELPHPIKFV